MEIILIGIQVIFGLLFYLFWQWLKKLPNSIHKRQEQSLQQQLTKEIELLKISQSQIQLRKIERFIDFAKIQTDILTNDDFKEKINNEDPDAVAKLRELVVELGIGLFFFASDSTVREYVNWKTESAIPGKNPYEVLTSLGDLMVSLRQDVGYDNTDLSCHDYLKMFITDWEEIQAKYSIT